MVESGGAGACICVTSAAAKATFTLNVGPKDSMLPGHHAAPDRVPPAREIPPCQGARLSGPPQVNRRLLHQ